MIVGVETGEDARTIGATQRRAREAVAEFQPSIDDALLQERHREQRVPTLVVGENEHDVRRDRLARPRLRQLLQHPAKTKSALLRIRGRLFRGAGRAMPRLTGSSSSIISMARILGAPLTVPAGKVARSRSMALIPGCRSPITLETMCMTWE